MRTVRINLAKLRRAMGTAEFYDNPKMTGDCQSFLQTNEKVIIQDERTLHSYNYG